MYKLIKHKNGKLVFFIFFLQYTINYSFHPYQDNAARFRLVRLFQIFIRSAFVCCLSCLVIVKAQEHIFGIRIILQTLKKHPVRNGTGCRITMIFQFSLCILMNDNISIGASNKNFLSLVPLKRKLNSGWLPATFPLYGLLVTVPTVEFTLEINVFIASLSFFTGV